MKTGRGRDGDPIIRFRLENGISILVEELPLEKSVVFAKSDNLSLDFLWTVVAADEVRQVLKRGETWPSSIRQYTRFSLLTSKPQQTPPKLKSKAEQW